MKKVKIAVIGPVKAGKTKFSNFISESSDAFQTESYNPTSGCRILEFEIENLHLEGKTQSVEVELWDCCGDEKYSNCWPAFSRESLGVVLLLDPANTNDNELRSWFEYFIQKQGLRDEQCLMVQSLRNPGEKKSRWKGPGDELSRMKMVYFDLADEEGLETLKNEFKKYVSTFLNSLSKKQDEDELFILNG